MFQPGDDLSFALEAFKKTGVFCEGRVQDLHRYIAIQVSVIGSVDRRHPALAKLIDNPVRTDYISNR
jgi:hypothetical protein